MLALTCGKFHMGWKNLDPCMLVTFLGESGFEGLFFNFLRKATVRDEPDLDRNGLHSLVAASWFN